MTVLNLHWNTAVKVTFPFCVFLFAHYDNTPPPPIILSQLKDNVYINFYSDSLLYNVILERNIWFYQSFTMHQHFIRYEIKVYRYDARDSSAKLTNTVAGCIVCFFQIRVLKAAFISCMWMLLHVYIHCGNVNTPDF